MTIAHPITEKDRRDTQSWLTRIGLAPKFGTCPIGHYQVECYESLGKIERAIAVKGIKGTTIRLRKRGAFIQCATVTEHPLSWIEVAPLYEFMSQR